MTENVPQTTAVTEPPILESMHFTNGNDPQVRDVSQIRDELVCGLVVGIANLTAVTFFLPPSPHGLTSTYMAIRCLESGIEQKCRLALLCAEDVSIVPQTIVSGIASVSKVDAVSVLMLKFCQPLSPRACLFNPFRPIS